MSLFSTAYRLNRTGIMLGLVALIPAGVATQAIGETWGEIAKIVADDRVKGDQFGFDVALSDEYAVIGANMEATMGVDAGSVYVFDMVNGTQLWELFASDAAAEDMFGMDVEVDGDLIVIGAPRDDDNGTDSGSAYLFSASTGTQLHKLVPTSGTTEDEFGWAVDIDEASGLVIVGAKLANGGTGEYSGKVYVFDTDTGEQIYELSDPNGASWDMFGFSVSLEGTTALIGAHDYDDGRGAVYVYDLTDGSEVRRLQALDADPADRFGEEVGLSGDLAIIGAYLDDEGGENAGAAYVFDITTGAQLHKFVSPGPAAFGWSVDLDGEYAVIGTFDFGSMDHAYIYNVVTGTLEADLEASDGGGVDDYGWNVDIYGNRAIVGAMDADGGGFFSKGKGAAYLYELGAGSDMTLSVSDPLFAGEDGLFIVTDGAPNAATYLAYSTAGLGSTYIPMLGITLDIDSPSQAGSAKDTDGGGTAIWSLPVPGNASGVHVWFQAAQMGLKSNNVEDRVIE